MLERYYNATDIIAFPHPQGFTSFFAYLGFMALPFDMFVQYTDHHVFDLQIDVLQPIFKVLGNTPEGVVKRHLLLEKVPRVRSSRMLKRMNDSRTVRILGREHSNAVLSGTSTAQVHRKQPKSTLLSKFFYSSFLYQLIN